MKRWLSFPSVQIALCAAVYALVGYYFGVLAFVVAAPLFAIAVARPLLALTSNTYRGMHQRIWRPVHGRHHAYKDIAIQVEEDDDHFRWVQLADVQKVVGVTATERTLSIAYPHRLQAMGQPATTHIRDDALVVHLDKMGTPAALRFRTWIERNIAFQGRRVRSNFGIQPDAGDPERSP